MEISVKRTNSNDTDFIELVRQLDAFLAFIDGDDHEFYAQFNKTNALQHALVLYEKDKAVACGALKPYDLHMMEVKRMYVVPEKRGKGYSKKVLSELENWAKEEGIKKLVLETGQRQAEAIGLYHSAGYAVIDNYGQYEGIDNSVCFAKEL